MATAKVTVETTAPAMLLPQELHGFIDLQTLEDIHRFLGDSELEDDLTLAAWIKQQYLYEPIQEDGRPVKTTESFAKLDHAYRRVRSLTNKAQDKWPFFDRKWKPMRSVLVKNNARGESAPGISLPGLEIAQDDAVDMERQSTPTGKVSYSINESLSNSTQYMPQQRILRLS